MEWNAAHRVHDDDERKAPSAATAAERAVWGVGSTITAVATLWCAVVGTGTFIIWSLARMGAGRPCRVTVRGGGQGRDKNVREGAGAGIVGMVRGVHGIGGVDVM